MRQHGAVSWYDVKEGRGIITDAQGNEYYVSSDVIEEDALKSGDEVAFEVNPNITDTVCAWKVCLLENEEPPEESDVQRFDDKEGAYGEGWKGWR